MINHGLTTNALIRRVRRHTGMTTLFRKEAERTRPNLQQLSPLLLGQPLLTPIIPPTETSVLPADPWETYSTANTPIAVNRGVEINPEQPLASVPGTATPKRFTAADTTASPTMARATMPPNPPSLGASQLTGTGQMPPIVQAKSIPPDNATRSESMQFPANAQLSPSNQQTSGGAPVPVTPAPNTPSTVARTDVQSPATPANQQATEDRTWTRLQAIYRGHKERESGVVNRDAPVQTQRAQPNPTARPENVAAPTGSQPKRMQAEASPLPPNQMASAPHFSQQQGSSRTDSSSQAEEIESNLQPPRTPSAQAPLQVAKPFSSTESSTNLSQTEESLSPLEMVWPVQRAPELTTGAEMAQNVSATGIQSESVDNLSSTPQLDETLYRQLATVKTSQPTDSAVDLITPRRPRPVQPTQVQNRAERLLQRTAEQQLTPMQTVQDSIDPALIETEAGILPGDLWRLIGETPPSPSDQRQGVVPVQRSPIDLAQTDAVTTQTSLPADARMAVSMRTAGASDRQTDPSFSDLPSPVSHQTMEDNIDEGLPSNIQPTTGAGIEPEHGHQAVSTSRFLQAHTPGTLDTAPKAASGVELQTSGLQRYAHETPQSASFAEAVVQRQGTHELAADREARENLPAPEGEPALDVGPALIDNLETENLPALEGEPSPLARSQWSNSAPVTSDLPPTNADTGAFESSSALPGQDVKANVRSAGVQEQAAGDATPQFSSVTTASRDGNLEPTPGSALPLAEGLATQAEPMQSEGEASPLRPPRPIVQRTITEDNKMLPGEEAPPVNKTQHQQDVVHNSDRKGQNVQRAAIDNAPLANTLPEKLAAPMMASTKQSTAPEIDTEELARQVFTQLKRKLMIERERQRPLVR